MGHLDDGQWIHSDSTNSGDGGRFERKAATFRNWITPDGSPGPSGEGGFEAEPGRYHLYVSLACPWAHRALIFRTIKGLEDVVGLSVVHWHMGDDGWTFADGDGVVPDTVLGKRYLRDVYTEADPRFTGRVTVPVLWDKRRHTIVSNESAEIIRMLDHAFDGCGAARSDHRPEALRGEIDALNARIYETVNNGVYKAGFARTQAAYEEAVEPLFETLRFLEDRLARSRYLAGERITEADWRLFTTLVRFDAVYHGHFKCNLRRLVDYPNLWAYTRDLFAVPGVVGTVRMDHIRRHYYGSHVSINPTGIVPVGPRIDFRAPHGRDVSRNAA
ncbi:glutathione S-transferase family protein [Jannaschia sp. W003]|uniref:glutathione S-transferase family protein n=1 Tax=Jannaschia sp. W003 TaxID=2867012 RepID=UPI0021A4DD2E|nr:glutathione S-transferase family protein [Jannaschia sp. W003]UWQ21073.1 glutathione S-transferase family protein [Jannaschia sp. W003]